MIINIPEEQSEKVDKIFKDHFNISIITKMEFLGFKKHTSCTFEKAEEFIEHSDDFNLDDEIIESVIDVRREHNIKLPDAIIASTAIEKDLTLVTRNVSDFNDINKLEIFNPFE